MSPSEPPRIRDERRDPDLTRLKERVAKNESRMDEHDKQLDTVTGALTGINHTLYGIPQDKTSTGLVGAVHDVAASLRSANNKLAGVLGTVVLALGIEIVRMLANH